MKETMFEANIAKIPDVTAMVEEELEDAGCPMKIQLQVSLSIDEIISNIANYAYRDSDGGSNSGNCRAEKTGKTSPRIPRGYFTISTEIREDPRAVLITFSDSGIPYDPLARKDPDVTLSLEERQIGGLGIFVVKKTMDEMSYERRDDLNILRLLKRF